MGCMNARVPQGSILGLLLFLGCLNDLWTGISWNPRFFTDDASLFWIVQDRNGSANTLNNDLPKIRN